MQKSVYEDNLAFSDRHSAEYIIWREGSHFHQTEMGFITGNFLGVIKRTHLSKLMFDLNVSAIDRFFRGEKIEGAFGDRDLGRNFKPSVFDPDFDLSFI
jgi:hypothetical protein